MHMYITVFIGRFELDGIHANSRICCFIIFLVGISNGGFYLWLLRHKLGHLLIAVNGQKGKHKKSNAL